MMLFKKEGKKTDPPPKEIDIYKISLSALDASIPSEKRPEVAKKIKSDLLSIEIGQDKVNIPNIETPQIGIEVNLGNISALEEQYAKDPFTLARLYISHMGLLATARMKGDVPDFEQNFLGLVRKYRECAKSMNAFYAGYFTTFTEYTESAMGALMRYIAEKARVPPTAPAAKPGEQKK